MGTEYYIIKPSTKQKLYLGSDWGYLEGIKQWCYNGDEKYEGEYVQYECYKEFLLDVMENCSMVIPDGWTWGRTTDIMSSIYLFITEGKVYLDNDCSGNNSWVDYEEIDYYIECPDEEDKIYEILQLIPHNEWETENHVVDEMKTIVKYIKKLQNISAKGE